MTQILQLNCAEKRNDMTITLGTTIKELLDEKLISVRTYNVCNSNRLNTVAEIKKYHDSNPDSFINLRNCGKKSTLELRSIIDVIQPEIKAVDKFDTVSQPIRQTFIDEYELFVNDPYIDENLVSFFQNKFPNPSSFFNATIYNYTDILTKYTGEPKLLYLFREQVIMMLCDIAKQLEHKLPEGDEFSTKVLNISNDLSNSFKQQFLVDFCKYKLHRSRRLYLELEYTRLVEDSSAIVQKLANSYIKSFYDLIPLFSLDKNLFVGKFGGKRKSALDFYINVRNPFYTIFEKILWGDVDEDALMISVLFPYISNEAVDWVKSFYIKHSYYPMFYIVCDFLKNSYIREHEMFCLRYGLNEQKIMFSLAEIAKRFDVTGERVRQILSKQYLCKEDIYKSPFWKHYFEQNIVLFTDTSDSFLELCSKENVSISFDAFAEICNIIFKFQFSDEFDCKFCCPKKYFSIIHSIFSKLYELRNTKCSEDTTMRICDILPKQTVETTEIRDAIFNIIIPSIGIEASNDTLYFKKNFVDIEKEAYQILYKNGEPLHIEDLVSQIKESNAQFELKDDTIKNKIRLSKIILPIGKTSMCKLQHWRNVFGGSIRDLLRKIMSERETPVSLDELTSLVTDVFESTNRNSINSNLSSSDEFVSFANGYFGLRSKDYPPQFVEVDLSKQRLSFNERFEQFQEFVHTYFRIPYCSGADDEDSLYRWYNNVFNYNVDSTEEQRRILKDFVESNKSLPQNGTEVRFKKLCQEYLDYVKTNYELPNHKEGATLYNWLKKTLPNYISYNDNRKIYFTKLIEELQSYGFNII